MSTRESPKNSLRFSAKVAAAHVLAASFLARAQDTPAPPPQPAAEVQPETKQPTTPWEVLIQTSANPAARRAAAITLIQTAATPPEQEKLSALIKGEGGEPLQTLMLRAIAARSTIRADWLLDPMKEAAATIDPARLPDIFSAAATLRSRPATRFLLSYATFDRPAPVRRAALASLRRLTGRAFDEDTARWLAWFASVEFLSEAEWTTALMEGLAAQADQLRAGRQTLVDQLVSSERERYLATPPEQRPALISEMFEGQDTALLGLAMDLVARELQSGRQITPQIGADLVALLAHERAWVRAQAGRLLSRVRQEPEGARTAIAAALNRETDPDAAASLLLCAARWPSPTAKQSVISWLESETEATPLALACLSAMQKAGLLTDERNRERILAVLQTLDDQTLGSEGTALLVSLGGSEGRRRVVTLLSSENALARTQAAQSLAASPGSLDAVLMAAAHDESLFDIAVQGVLRHRPDATGFIAIQTLAAPTTQAKHDALLQLTATLSPEELIWIAQGLPEEQLQLKADMLSRLTDLPAGGAEPPMTPGRAIGLFRLAETRFSLNDPAGTIAALDLIPAEARAPVNARIADLFTTCYAWLNLPQQAAEANGSPDAWLDAIDRVRDQAFASDIVDAMVAKFGPDAPLSPQQQARLDTLRKEFTEAPPDAGPETPPAEGEG